MYKYKVKELTQRSALFFRYLEFLFEKLFRNKIFSKLRMQAQGKGARHELADNHRKNVVRIKRERECQVTAEDGKYKHDYRNNVHIPTSQKPPSVSIHLDLNPAARRSSSASS